MRFDYLPPFIYSKLFRVQSYSTIFLASIGFCCIFIAIFSKQTIMPIVEQIVTLPNIETVASEKTLGQQTINQIIEDQIFKNPPQNWNTVRVHDGDTLSKIFTNLGIPNSTLHAIINSNPTGKKLSNLSVGQKLHFLFSSDQELKAIKMPFSSTKTLHIHNTETGYKYIYEENPIIKKLAYYSNTIKDSLFASAQSIGLSDKIIMQLADIFGCDIDFALDIRENDSFRILFEEEYLGDQKINTGKIIMAEFINQNRTYQAIRFTDKNGRTGYYSPNGYSMQKAFLRTPVKFTRISSHFSTKRQHPILHKIRAHKGVDYAAPRGTPVKAAGDGKIIFMGNKGGFGKTLALQHGNKYSTLYAHLLSFVPNLKMGSKVKQGQTIGFVGKTGLASGYHLHYEFRVNGVHRNPLTVKLPQSKPIDRKYKEEFVRYSKQVLALLDEHEINYLARNG